MEKSDFIVDNLECEIEDLDESLELKVEESSLKLENLVVVVVHLLHKELVKQYFEESE